MRIYYKYLFYLFYIVKFPLIVIILSGIILGSHLHVRIQDPVYEYLDRLSTQGMLTVYMNGTLPLTRDYIADMLMHLEKERDKLSTMQRIN